MSEPPKRTIWLAVVLASVVLAGCGSTAASTTSVSAPRPAPKPGSRHHLPELVEGLTSPAISRTDELASQYTCDGANISFPLQWSKIPAHTAELLLTVIDFKFVHNEPVVHWAVSHLSPKLHGLAAGRLPAHAIVGRNSSGQAGYSLCPPKGASTEYAISLFALPRRLPAGRGFSSVALRYQALHLATSEALLTFTYKRR
jgi:phosphatidylethanolamine-binding protein (PEBP) family uncharacterized protein